MKIDNKIFTWLVPAGIVAVGGTIIYLIINSQKSATTTTAKTPPGQPPPVTPPPGCTYPLAVGSNNACVGQLQAALGIKQDNQFGPATLSALVSQANGKTSIANAADLTAVIAAIQSAGQAANNAINTANNASLLVTQYQGGQFSNWVVNGNTTWIGISFPALTANGANLTLQAGASLPMSQYNYVSTTSDGYLILLDNIMMVYYKADPNALTTS